MEKASKLVSKPSGGRGHGNVISHPTRTSPRKVGNTHATLSEMAQGDVTHKAFECRMVHYYVIHNCFC